MISKHLDEIDKNLVSFVIAERRKPHVRICASGQRRECKPGADTVNRFLTRFRAVLNKASEEWEWIDRVPRIKALKGAKSRVRWISRDEADRLIAELPEHLAALAVPLTDKSVAILEARRGHHPRWVFAIGCKPVHQTSTRAWYEATARAGIEDFCWHDLRHTWASWHVQQGTPLHVLQELGGWSSIRMVQRYAHLSGERLRAWVERPATTPVVDNDLHRCDAGNQITSQLRHSQRQSRPQAA